MQSINYSRLAVGKLAADSAKLSSRCYEIANPKSFHFQTTRFLGSISRQPVARNAIQNSQNFRAPKFVRELVGTRSSLIGVQNYRNFASSTRQTNSQLQDRSANGSTNMATQTCTISTSATTKSVQTKTSQLNPPNNEEYYMNLEHTYGAHNYHPLPVVLKVSVL